MTAEYSEVSTYWRGVVGTLAQRGLLRQRVGGAKVIPEAIAVVEPERVSFVLDMLRLAGVSRESWLDRGLWAQIRAALQGRRCFVADSGGLAVVVAREPGEPERKRLPGRVVLSADLVPDGPYTAYLGESRSGPVVLDLAGNHRAVLIGGATRSGKTCAITSLILQAASKCTPDELRLALIDLKELDLVRLAGLPHIAQPIATTEGDAASLVGWCLEEMRRRQAILRAEGVTCWSKSGQELPLLLVAVDEAADFAKDETVMGGLVELARKGAASGISLILATQRPDAQVISPQVKANLTTRIGFRTTTGIESRVILDAGGTQNLRRVGLCLTNAAGSTLTKVQAAFIPDAETGDWVTSRPTGSVLDKVEQSLVEFALDELGGAFTINTLAEAFKGKVSRRRLLKIGKAWELRGWLTSPNDVTTPRCITQELESLARGTTLGPVVTRGTSGHVVPDFEPGGYPPDELPSFLLERFEVEND